MTVDEPDRTSPHPGARTDRARAQALMQVGRTDEAVQVLSAALANDPNDASMWCDLALCHFRMDRNDEALDAVHRALAVNPAFEWAHRLRAHILVAAGDRMSLAEADQASLEALYIDPYSVAGWAVRSRVLRARKDFGGARAAAQRAIELEPSSPIGHEAYGLAMLAMGLTDEAERAFRHQLSIDPMNPSAINNLGRVLLKSGRDQEAMQLFAQAAAMDPSEPAYRSNVGLSAYRLTRVSLPLGLIAIAAAFAFGGWGLFVVLAAAGIYTGFNRWRLRRGRLKGPDGQPLPPAAFEALKDFERVRRKRLPMVPLVLMLGGLMMLTLLFSAESWVDAETFDRVAVVGVLMMVSGTIWAIIARIRARRSRP